MHYVGYRLRLFAFYNLTGMHMYMYVLCMHKCIQLACVLSAPTCASNRSKIIYCNWSPVMFRLMMIILTLYFI